MRELIRQKILDSLATPLPHLTRRDVRLPKVTGKAVAVLGMRRSGKTCFLWQIIRDRVQAGTPREGLLYFSFEDERLAGLTASDLHMLVEEYYRLHPSWRDRKKVVFLFDEIQNVPGWELFVRRLIDTEKVEIFVSGSSAGLLSREVSTSMRGRAVEAVVYPFGFREVLRHLVTEPSAPPGRLPKAERAALDKQLREYLTVGGFPETVGLPSPRDRWALLNSYVDVAILRDVVERHAVSHPVALRWMVRQLLSNASGSFSINRFYNDLKSQGIPVAKDTLHSYLSHLEDAFLIRTVSLATASERQRMVNPRKVYPIDPGLIPLFDRTGLGNLGHALETCVLLELDRRGAEVSYLKTPEEREVDFLARYPDGKLELIQSCYELDDALTKEREMKALVEAGRLHRKADLILITAHPEGVRGIPSSVQVLNASEWLLGSA